MQKYCCQNMDYLCQKNGITKEELRKSLKMPKLQFFHPNFPKASAKIAGFFSISQEEFIYEDLQIPKKFRFISNLHGREEYCKSLIKDLPESINKWCDTDIEILNSLYGFSEKYKYISFHICYEDYDLIMLCMHNNNGNEVEEGYERFPQGGIAYGYINFRAKYELAFNSYKDEGFITLCDEVLKCKDICANNWIEPVGFSPRKRTNFKIQLSPVTEEMLLEKVNLMSSYVFLFEKTDLDNEFGWREREELITLGKKLIYENDDELLNQCMFNNTVKKYLVRIQLYMENARTKAELDNLKKHFDLVAKNEQEIIEKERREQEEVVTKYGKGQMYQETVALASYIWAKRIYSMSQLCEKKYEERELSGYESNIDKAISLSEYIAAFERGEIVSYCSREVDDFVTIIVILFARSNKSMTILRKQIEIRDIEGIHLIRVTS